MPYDVVFFDFDGTLVDSAHLKRQAFHDLFPDGTGYQAVVEEVLTEDPDGSRYRVIPEMAARMRARNLELPPEEDDKALVERYARLAVDAVSGASEIDGATKLLTALKNRGVLLCLCSNTPGDAIRVLIDSRGWDAFFKHVTGYPDKKEAFISRVLAETGISSEKACMVGDGPSDERAAAANGIDFQKVELLSGLQGAVGEALGVPDVQR